MGKRFLGPGQRIAIFAVSAMLTCGCGTKKTFVEFNPPRDFVPPTNLASTNHDAPEYARAWNRFTSIDEYHLSGKTNARWDAFVTAAFEAYVEATSPPNPPERLQALKGIMAEQATRAVEAGCDDPLLQYLYARHVLTAKAGVTREMLAQVYGNAAEAIKTTAYSPLRKMFVTMRAADEIRATSTSTNIPSKLREYKSAAIRHLNNALQDRMMPPRRAAQACQEMLETCLGDPTAWQELERLVFPTLDKFWGDHGFANLFKGNLYIEKAWHARGNLGAETVTPDGWKGFEQNLTLAEKALRQAWSQEKEDAQIPAAMITICMANGSPRKEMELWFERAMKIDPACMEAAESKGRFLLPQWNGSIEEALAFGRECVASTNWSGRVPLMLAYTHENLAELDESLAQTKAYWHQPGVWPDLKSSYEKYFELGGDELRGQLYYSFYVHKYALSAYRCEQYGAFIEQISKLGEDIEYVRFGGRAEFEEMLKLAREKTKKE